MAPMADELLGALRRAGELNDVDWHLAQWLLRAGAGEVTALAGAVASRAARHGQLFVDLTRLRGPVQAPTGSALDGRSWPDWGGLSDDALVAIDPSERPVQVPLVLRGQRLYLARWDAHEQHVGERMRDLAQSAGVERVDD